MSTKRYVFHVNQRKFSVLGSQIPRLSLLTELIEEQRMRLENECNEHDDNDVTNFIDPRAGPVDIDYNLASLVPELQDEKIVDLLFACLTDASLTRDSGAQHSLTLDEVNVLRDVCDEMGFDFHTLVGSKFMPPLEWERCVFTLDDRARDAFGSLFFANGRAVLTCVTDNLKCVGRFKYHMHEGGIDIMGVPAMGSLPFTFSQNDLCLKVMLVTKTIVLRYKNNNPANLRAAPAQPSYFDQMV